MGTEDVVTRVWPGCPCLCRRIVIAPAESDEVIVALLETIAFVGANDRLQLRAIPPIGDDVILLARNGLDDYDVREEGGPAREALERTIGLIESKSGTATMQALWALARRLVSDLDDDGSSWFVWSVVIEVASDRGDKFPAVVSKDWKGLVSSIRNVEEQASLHHPDDWQWAYVRRHPDSDPDVLVRQHWTVDSVRRTFDRITSPSSRAEVVRWGRRAAVRSGIGADDLKSPWSSTA